MSKLADDTSIGGASAIIRCYCDSEDEHEIIWPQNKFVCPNCQSVLYIEWKLTVAMDMITPGFQYTTEVERRMRERQRTAVEGLEPYCPWEWDESDQTYKTGCGDKIHQGASDPEFRYCPTCGREVNLNETD